MRKCIFLRDLQSALPRRLFLVRHGESEANVNPAVYSHTPDWRIRLTPEGVRQAEVTGAQLRQRIGVGPVSFYVSPYVRARQTFDEIAACFEHSQVVGVREDERLREQEMGNYQPIGDMQSTWAERHDHGRFFFRFPGGENGADVCDRVSSFLDSLFREREDDMVTRNITNDSVVIIVHGLMLRLFIARWYKLPLEVFDRLYNPPNGAVIEMARDDVRGKLVLTPDSLRLMGVDEDIEHVSFDGSDMVQYYLAQISHGQDPS